MKKFTAILLTLVLALSLAACGSDTTTASDGEGTTAEQVNKELAELSREEVLRLISSMEDDMAAASRDMDFEEAARLRDQVVKLKSTVEDKSEEDVLKDLKRGARKGSAYGNRKHAAYGSSRAN